MQIFINGYDNSVCVRLNWVKYGSKIVFEYFMPRSRTPRSAKRVGMGSEGEILLFQTNGSLQENPGKTISILCCGRHTNTYAKARCPFPLDSYPLTASRVSALICKFSILQSIIKTVLLNPQWCYTFKIVYFVSYYSYFLNIKKMYFPLFWFVL